jgi:hemin uptake protein HemP
MFTEAHTMYAMPAALPALHATSKTGPGAASGSWVHPIAPTTAESLDSSLLLKGRKTVEIMHNGNVYRLQATKLGKLILTK